MAGKRGRPRGAKTVTRIPSFTIKDLDRDFDACAGIIKRILAIVPELEPKEQVIALEKAGSLYHKRVAFIAEYMLEKPKTVAELTGKNGAPLQPIIQLVTSG